jgi:hypothetical protein
MKISMEQAGDKIAGNFAIMVDGFVIVRSNYDESVTDEQNRRTRLQALEEAISYLNGFKEGFVWARNSLRLEIDNDYIRFYRE